MIILLIQWLCIHTCCYCLSSDTTYCRNSFVPQIYLHVNTSIFAVLIERNTARNRDF